MNLQIFRKILKKMLREKKLTINALSLEADLSADTLHSLIYGKSQDIKLSTLIKIADVLECTLDNLIGRSLYSKEEQNMIDRICCLPPHSRNMILFMLDLEENSILKKSISGQETIQVYIPTGNIKEGMLYDSGLFESLDISDYPVFLKQNTDLGIKIASKNYEPIYYPNDILLLSHKQTPQYNDIVLYIDDIGRLYIRKYTENYLLSINGFGRNISTKDIQHYTPLGVVLRVVKEFDIENYR